MSFLKPKPATSTQSSTNSSTQSSTNQSSSLSDNQNNGLITGAYAPQMQQGVQANNYMSNLLGIPSSTVNAVGNGANQIAEAGGAQAGYNNYLQNAGYAPAMRQLSQGVTGQGAAAGILNSGTTAKALQSRGTELNQGFFNNYLQNLNQVAANGVQAGGLITNAGQRSQSQSSGSSYGTSTGSSTGGSTGGSPSTIGSIASTVGGIASIFSDRRLKTAIRKVGEFADGLGIYSFRYIGQSNRIRGVMADEVEKLRPWALGRTCAGFQTVNYGAL